MYSKLIYIFLRAIHKATKKKKKKKPAQAAGSLLTTKHDASFYILQRIFVHSKAKKFPSVLVK